MGNLRKLANNLDYNEINREERNLCAILFHLLHINDNMCKFISLLKSPFGASDEVTGVYVEYAYARDLWKKVCSDDRNRDKRVFILKKIGLIDSDQDVVGATDTVRNFNSTFVAGTKISETEVQNPGRWSVCKLDKFFENDHRAFLSACKFKWAFNVKPDLVIHLNGNKAICIEAKFESYEDQYPGNKAERKIFENRFKDSWLGYRMSQTQVQQYLMKDILGLTAHLVFLRKSRQNKGEQDNNKLPQELTWPEVFSELDRDGIPNYMEQAVESAIKNSELHGRRK